MDAYRHVERGLLSFFIHPQRGSKCGLHALINALTNQDSGSDRHSQSEIYELLKQIEEGLVVQERKVGGKDAKVLGTNFQIQVLKKAAEMLKYTVSFYGQGEPDVFVRSHVSAGTLVAVVNTGGHYVAVVAKRGRFFKINSMGTLVEEFSESDVLTFLSFHVYITLSR